MAKFSATQLINKVVKSGRRVVGVDARHARARADMFNKNRKFGTLGIPSKTVMEAEHAAKFRAGKTFHARVKALTGTALVGGGGFLGLHKYHQHKDNKILERIDKMYGKD